jgi:hypothetical protein
MAHYPLIREYYISNVILFMLACPLVVIIPPSLLYIPRRHFHFESSCNCTFMWESGGFPLEEAYYLCFSFFQGVEYLF